MTKQNAINNVELDKAENLDDLPNRETALTNLGFGAPSFIQITDADFSGGLYTLTNPCPRAVLINVVGPGLVVRLPPAQDTPSYNTFAFAEGVTLVQESATQVVHVQLSDGTPLGNIRPSEIFKPLLIDKSTVAGTWTVEPIVATVNGKAGIVTITGSDIFPNGQLFDNQGTPKLSEDWWNRGLFWHDGTTQVLDWENQSTSDQSGVVTMQWSNRQLYDSTPNLSIDWQNRNLFDSSILTSINWQNRNLFLNDGVTLILDWQNQWLFDAIGNPSINWNARLAYDETGQQSIVWFRNSRFLKDNSSLTSVDWHNRELIINNGTTVVLNWQNSMLLDTSGNTSADWQNRLLRDSTPNTSLDWQNRVTLDTSSVQSTDWQNRFLVDNAGNVAENWNTRQLFANDGTTLKMDWSSPNMTTFNSIQGIEFAIVPGVAPIANYIKVNGAPTGNSPIFTSVGSDTNVDMTFMTQAAGSIDFTSGTTTLLLLANQASAVNNFSMSVATTGNSPILQVGGTDVNVGLKFLTQGAGGFNFSGGNGTSFFINNLAGAPVNFLEVSAANTGASPVLTAIGGDPNIDLRLTPQGTGVIRSASSFAGFGFQASEAANGKQGVATLVAGAVTVSNTNITANSRIFLTPQDNNTIGALRISARNPGVNFTITSTVGGDTGVIAYEIFEPA